MVALCIDYGNAPLSAYAYGLYGLLLCGVLDDIELGYQFGKLALDVLEKFDAKEIKCRVYNKFYSFILHWKDAAKNTLDPLRETIKVGLDTGEIEFTCYATVNYCHNLALLGMPLDDVQPEIQSCIGLIQSLKQKFQLYYTQIWGQFVSNLRGESQDKIQLIGEFYDETQNLPILLENDNFSSLYCFYLTKTILAYLFEDYDRALVHVKKAEQYESGIVGLFPFSQNSFYSSLVLLARYFSIPELERSQSLNQVIDNQKKLKKWAESAPMNYGHKYELVEAEKARVLGQILEAEELYDRAIEGARDNEYLHEEALAYELAAKFYLERGRERIARTYMQEAHYAYARWRATAKVEDLEAKYPQLLSNSTTKTTTSSRTTIAITTGSQSGEVLDLATVMKASNAIGREIELEKLLANLMQVSIENAGAQTGFLVLETSGKWVIEASGDADTDRVTVLQSLSLKNRLPESIVNYVVRTQEIVVEADAVNRGRFTNDLEIQTRQIRSVLCAPLLNQGRLSGIVYLENNLATDAFTSERLQTIQMLSGQAAIAIANARLYAEVRENERRLKQFLEAMPVGVAIHNATGEVEYLNQLAKQLTAFDAIPEAKNEQLARVYGACRAGTEQLYPTEELPVSRSLRGETVKIDDLELRRRDRVIPLEVSSTPILDEKGKIQYAIAAFQDITKRQQVQKILEDYNSTLERQVAERTEALQQTNEELKIALQQLQTTQKQLVESEKMSALGGLVAGIAHEVNTPLGIGVAVASHLFDKTADLTQAYRTGKMKKSQLEHFLDTSERSTQLLLGHLKQAAELIQNFKQVAVDRSSEARRTFKLKEYLQAIAMSFQPQLRGTNHQIEVGGEDSLTLDSYPGALSQIVTNFLTNS
ncbi:MAG: GAF domain-containing protein, partial [Cyanobacteriota bacterium]|nr:GAF domain-containing protein [Cyanobacteriota bacterium]